MKLSFPQGNDAPVANLNELAVFAAAGSYTQAARQLDMPKSQVSRKVRQLEERLGPDRRIEPGAASLAPDRRDGTLVSLMAGPRIPSFLGYLLRRKAHNAHDLQVADELGWTAANGLPWPAGLEMEWLGTSGFRLRYQGFQLLIDPYLTRIPMGALLARRVVAPSAESIRQHIDGADAILIGHTHFDHALDTPKISEMFECPVYGSRSTANLMALYGQRERMHEVENYRVYELGPFEVTFVPSVHSKLYMGLSVPYSGDVCCDHFDDLTPAAYKCGQVYGIHIKVAGTTFYHQGSADLLEDAMAHKGVDVFLAGIAGRGFTRDYAGRILHCLQPNVVIPNHYDNFFRPLGAPMEFSTNVNLAGFVDDVAAVSREFRVATLAPLQTIGATANSPGSD